MDGNRKASSEQMVNGCINMREEDRTHGNYKEEGTEESREQFIPIDVYATINELDTSPTAGGNIRDLDYDTINSGSTELDILAVESDSESKTSHSEGGTYNRAYHKSPHIFTLTDNNRSSNNITEVEEMFREVTGVSYTSETEDEKVPSDETAKIECGRNKVLVTMIVICLSVLLIFVLLYYMTTTNIGTKKETAINPYLACTTASNLTRRWRLDHNGSDIRPGIGKHSSGGYVCDLHEDLQWFRLAGKAGTHILDRCPKYKSCGAQQPYWTDAEMPEEEMVVSYITAYGVEGSECRKHNISMEVIRCSLDTEHDFIYRYTGPYKEKCYEAFCGMT